MPRLPYAAVQLIKQVGEERDNVEVAHGEPDGLDVVREITFDKATSKWLWARMQSKLDPRVANGVYTSRKGLTLTFQSNSSLADDKAEFDLSLPDDTDAPEPEGGFPEVTPDDDGDEDSTDS